MFGKSTSSSSSSSSSSSPQTTTRTERNEQSFLQSGVRLKGEIHVDGDLRIEGTVEGILDTRGVLMIGPKAVVDGELRGREVVIHGCVSGVIRAEQRVHLARGAKIKGDLHCRALVIEEGVHFDGRSHMGEEAAKRPPKTEASGKSGGAPQPQHPGTYQRPGQQAGSLTTKQSGQTGTATQH